MHFIQQAKHIDCFINGTPLCVDGAGKFNRHLDYWDAIENQEYFSWEAFGHVLQQMTDISRIPKDLPTPFYTILKKFKEFEIRRCSTQSPLSCKSTFHILWTH